MGSPGVNAGLASYGESTPPLGFLITFSGAAIRSEGEGDLVLLHRGICDERGRGKGEAWVPDIEFADAGQLVGVDLLDSYVGVGAIVGGVATAVESEVQEIGGISTGPAKAERTQGDESAAANCMAALDPVLTVARSSGVVATRGPAGAVRGDANVLGLRVFCCSLSAVISCRPKAALSSNKSLVQTNPT